MAWCPVRGAPRRLRTPRCGRAVRSGRFRTGLPEASPPCAAVTGRCCGRGGTAPGVVPPESARRAAPPGAGGASGKRAEAGGGGGLSESMARGEKGRRPGKRGRSSEEPATEPGAEPEPPRASKPPPSRTSAPLLRAELRSPEPSLEDTERPSNPPPGDTGRPSAPRPEDIVRASDPSPGDTARPSGPLPRDTTRASDPRSAEPYASRCRRPTTPNWTRGPRSRPTPQARTAPAQPADPRIPHSARGTGRPGRTRAARTHRPGTLTRPRVPVPRRPLAWAPEGRRRSAPPFVTVLGIPGALHASHALEVPAVPALFDPPDRFPVPRAPGVPDAPETGVPPDAGPQAEPETGPETAPEPALAPCPETEPGAGPEASLAPAPEKNPGAEPEAGTGPVPALKSAPETEPEVPSVTAPGFSEAPVLQEAPVGPEPSAAPAKPDPGRSKPPSPVAIAPSDPGHPAASVTSAESISPAEFTEATGSRDPTESREFTGPAEAVGFSGSPGPRHPTPPAIQVHVALPCSCTPVPSYPGHRSSVCGPPYSCPCLYTDGCPPRSHRHAHEIVPGNAYPPRRTAIPGAVERPAAFLRACASLYGLPPLGREPVHAPGASARTSPYPAVILSGRLRS